MQYKISEKLLILNIFFRLGSKLLKTALFLACFLVYFILSNPTQRFLTLVLDIWQAQ